jgi:hypothetical protein
VANKTMYEVGVNSKKATSELKNLGSSLSNVGRNAKNTSSKFAGLFSSIRKNNVAFNNMTKDANRASASLVKVGTSANRMMTGLKTGAVIYLSRQIAEVTNVAIQGAMDMVETANLFAVAMGTASDSAGDFANEMTRVSGLDNTNLKNAVGTFGLLSRSMGINNENAETLSLNMAQLALDLSSLTNIPINQVMQDLRSGLVGQSETVYKYGLDVTEAGIKAEAMAQGIKESVRNMGQGEKMALRYAVMIKQASLSHGDFAKTIEAPANQARIFKERITTLTRVIGSVLLPTLGLALPYLNAFVALLTRAVQSLAIMVGFEIPDFSSGFQGIGQDADDTSDSIDGVGKSLKAVMGGFDELNTIQDSSGAGSGVGIGDPNDFNFTGYESGILGLKQKSDELLIGMTNQLSALAEKFKPLTDSLNVLLSLTWDAMIWAMDNVFRPLATWSWDSLLPSLISVLSGAIDVLSSTLVVFKPYGIWLWDNFLNPMATFTGGVIVATLELVGTALSSIGSWMSSNESVVRTFTNVVASFFAIWEITKLLAFIQMSGGLISALKLITGSVKVLTLAKLADNAQTVILTALYAKDFLLSILASTKAIIAQGIAFVATKASLVASTIATGAMTLAVGAYSVAQVVANVAGTAFGVIIGVLTSPITLIILAITGLVAGIVLLWKNWDIVVESMTKVWEKFKEVISGMPNFLIALAGPLAPLLLLIKYFDDVKNAINSVMEAFKNFKLFDFSTPTPPVDKTPSINTKGSFLKGYATGGFPSTGEIFMAREAGPELVGSIGGSSAVVNNDQIVEAVSRGVAQAVASVMNTGGQVIENVMVLDGDVIYKNQQKVAKSRGLNFDLGGFAR